MIVTGAQVRMARGYLRWPVAELAKRAGIGVSTVERIEASDGAPPVRVQNLEGVVSALEAAGIEFTPGNGHGPGVRLKKPLGE